MHLRYLTISKIDSSYGLQTLTNTLFFICKNSTPSERFYINNTILYFRSLYVLDQDITNDFIEYKDEIDITLQILRGKAIKYPSETIDTIIEIIEHNQQYVSNIKKIS